MFPLIYPVCQCISVCFHLFGRRIIVTESASLADTAGLSWATFIAAAWRPKYYDCFSPLNIKWLAWKKEKATTTNWSCRDAQYRWLRHFISSLWHLRVVLIKHRPSISLCTVSGHLRTLWWACLFKGETFIKHLCKRKDAFVYGFTCRLFHP